MKMSRQHDAIHKTVEDIINGNAYSQDAKIVIGYLSAKQAARNAVQRLEYYEHSLAKVTHLADLD